MSYSLLNGGSLTLDLVTSEVLNRYVLHLFSEWWDGAVTDGHEGSIGNYIIGKLYQSCFNPNFFIHNLAAFG